ncbi:MAG: response regulator [Bacteroidales bacterium]|nr:response regulator [Bacteroidales bacterium]
MLRTVIIDDEAPARDLLRHYLKDIDSVEIVGECENGFEGLKVISEMKPDLVILDIQMPKLTGFEMLEVLNDRPNVIFATAYDQYAIKAFELCAADYLLKPFSKERLQNAISKVVERKKENASTPNEVDNVIHAYYEQINGINRIVVKKGNTIKVIPLSDIKYLEAEGDYVMVHYSDGKALKQQTMKYFEENLPSSFVRIHRAYIVNIDLVIGIEPYGKDVHVAILSTGEKLQVSKIGYKNIKERLRL